MPQTRKRSTSDEALPVSFCPTIGGPVEKGLTNLLFNFLVSGATNAGYITARRALLGEIAHPGVDQTIAYYGTPASAGISTAWHVLYTACKRGRKFDRASVLQADWNMMLTALVNLVISEANEENRFGTYDNNYKYATLTLTGGIILMGLIIHCCMVCRCCPADDIDAADEVQNSRLERRPDAVQNPVRQSTPYNDSEDLVRSGDNRCNEQEDTATDNMERGNRSMPVAESKDMPIQDNNGSKRSRRQGASSHQTSDGQHIHVAGGGNLTINYYGADSKTEESAVNRALTNAASSTVTGRTAESKNEDNLHEPLLQQRRDSEELSV